MDNEEDEMLQKAIKESEQQFKHEQERRFIRGHQIKTDQNDLSQLMEEEQELDSKEGYLNLGQIQYNHNAVNDNDSNYNNAASS